MLFDVDSILAESFMNDAPNHEEGANHVLGFSKLQHSSSIRSDSPLSMTTEASAPSSTVSAAALVSGWGARIPATVAALRTSAAAAASNTSGALGVFDVNSALVRDVVNNVARPKFNLVLNCEAVLQELRHRWKGCANNDDNDWNIAVPASSGSSDGSAFTADLPGGAGIAGERMSLYERQAARRGAMSTAAAAVVAATGEDDGEPTRQERIDRYRQKRLRRAFSKKVRYSIRKANAERRPRYKGRFVNPKLLLESAL